MIMVRYVVIKSIYVCKPHVHKVVCSYETDSPDSNLPFPLFLYMVDLLKDREILII